jgi:hypothetical protein
MKIEIFDKTRNQWIRKDVDEANAVLSEIDKMDSIGNVALDYKLALSHVVQTIIDMSSNKYQPVRN